MAWKNLSNPPVLTPQDDVVLRLGTVGVHDAGGNVGKVTGFEQSPFLVAVAMLEKDADRALADKEDFVDVGVLVAQDAIALGLPAGENVELALGLVGAEQHGDERVVQLGVLALAVLEEVGLGSSGENSAPARLLPGPQSSNVIVCSSLDYA
jgi:hypothetical protein